MTQFTVTVSGIGERRQATAITKSLSALWPELTITARKAKPRRRSKRSSNVVLKKEARGY